MIRLWRYLRYYGGSMERYMMESTLQRVANIAGSVAAQIGAGEATDEEIRSSVESLLEEVNLLKSEME